MTRLLLIRHGETDWNRVGRVQGQTDVPLNETGYQQASRIAARLASEKKIRAIYSSDLQRAYETARAIAAYHPHLAIRPDARLREVMLGDWESKQWADLEAAEGESIFNWRRDVSAVTPSGAESMHAMSLRLKAFLRDLLEDHPEETVVVAAHGGSIRMIIAIAMECPLKMAWRFGTDNASLAELLINPDGPFLKILNDTRHLNGINSDAFQAAPAA